MSKHTTLDQLKMLAQRTKAEIDQVESKSLVGIKVNGTAAGKRAAYRYHRYSAGRELERQSSDCAGRVPLSRQQVLVHCMC